MDVWQYRARHPEEGRVFDEAMTSFSSVVNAAIVASYDFSSINKIVDVGGGNGSLITAILRANPSIQGVLFDLLPHVIAKAEQRIEREGLSGRCQVVAGDFFDAVPRGGDAYLLKWIIHDWDDERGAALLRNCGRAMAKDGRLLLVEAVIPRDNSPSFHKFMDLTMLVMTGGRERTEAEYRALLAAAGFRLTRIVPTPSEMRVIEGVPA
jgi:SAM-dependent methyltransferase